MKSKITLSRHKLNYFLISSILTAGAVLLASIIYTKSDYYTDFLAENTRGVISAGMFPLVFAYIAIIFYRAVTLQQNEKSKSMLIFEYFENSLQERKLPTLTPETKTAFLSVLVKFFFFPIMLNTVLINGLILLGNAQDVLNFGLDDKGFPFFNSLVMTVIFFLDTLIFAFGYLFEGRALKSSIKSVEPTFLGWAVALATYPPFNDLTGRFLPLPQGSGSDELSRGIFSLFGVSGGIWTDLAPVVYMFLHFVVLILFAIYLWATFALGTRSSNLTNRGIVNWGPYIFIRHPAYVSKNLAWWVEGLIFATSPMYFISLLGWNFLYFMRAKTEERHLGVDADYVKYKKQVKWMFIPGIV